MQRRNLLALAAAACGAGWTWAEEKFPSRPLRLIVPFPVGGPADTTARGLAVKLSQKLGQSVVVDNRPGANTMIGADLVAKSKADGYTLLYATDATISINPLIYKKMSYEPARDFVPVSGVMHAPEFLIVNSSLPVNSLKEFIQYAKDPRNSINYGSIGIGSNAHLAAEAIASSVGGRFNHVPYKGSAEVVPALINGDVQFLILSPSLIHEHVKSGRLKVLAVMSRERSILMPEVPTFTEAGLPGFDNRIWFGVFAPKGIPAQVQAQLEDAIKEIVASDDFTKKVLIPAGMEPIEKPGGDFLKGLLQANKDRYSRYVKIANIKMD